ncbi:MAG TPA: hypothetical protein VFS72_16520, partial [Agromyces sp.]|nr:hypothetical protein [Agromyces sp.]
MTDLGDLARIATALGLVRDGSPNDDWFAEPDRFLAQVLSDPQQRDALVGTLDDLLGGGDAAAGGARTRVPILERGAVALDLVIDVVDGGSRVHLGLGVRVRRTADADSAGVRIEAYVPLFAADGSEQVASPLLLGAVDGTIELELAVELPTSTAVGGVALTAVEVGARIPTIGGATPVLTLALRGLRMPGSPDPTDLVVDPAALGGLGGTLTELVLALLRARTSDLPVSDPARALAGLLGLIPGDDVPDFPFVALAARGPVALAGWWATALEGAARASWLGYLADLLGAQVVTPAGLPVVVALDLGGDANLTIGLDVLPGAAGLPSVTPNLTVETRGATGVTLALEAQPVSVDLATHAAVALPALRLVARVADPAGGSLLGPVDSGTPAMSVRLGSLEAGFALDADRRPTLVLAALDAQVGATPYDRLDLTNGDAVAAASAQTVAQVAGSLISGLGTLGGVLGPLIGLSGPVPVDPVRLLSDPVGAIRDRWAALLDEPAATVRGVLQTLQGAISDAARAAEPVSGAGTAADPYRIALAEGVDLV